MSATPRPAGARGEQASSAPRRPMADPDRFLIPEQMLPPGFAAMVEQPPDPPAPAHPAATVVVLRPGADGPEALLLRRPQRSRFAAGAWVFPGGRVDEADAESALRERSLGPSPDAWAARLALDDPATAFAYVAAAVREAWEETGLVLAPEARRCTPERRRALDEARRALLAEELSFADAAHQLDLHLDTADLLYVAHWITPVAEPRRYDTRFFAARVPAGAECHLHGDELVEAAWLRPDDAVRRFGEGSLKLLPPTAHTLRRLAGFPSLDALWDTLREAPVPAYLPRMRRVEDGVVIELQ